MSIYYMDDHSFNGLDVILHFPCSGCLLGGGILNEAGDVGCKPSLNGRGCHRDRMYAVLLIARMDIFGNLFLDTV